MKIKKEKVKYEKKLKVVDKVPKKIIDYKWLLIISLVAFLLSCFFSGLTEIIVPNLNSIIGIIVVLIIVFINVLFDMIGTAITAADIAPLNSMAAKRIKGSRLAIELIKNAEKTSAICNDVIGDVCGIISGSVGVLISSIIAKSCGFSDSSITTLLVTAIIAALTIGGKSIGKSIAINKSDVIVFKFAKFLSVFKKER